MPKKRKGKALLNHQPLPADFHPKDASEGIIWRPLGVIGAGVSHRQTVVIGVGGAEVEMTVERAKQFAAKLNYAIKCAETPP